MSIETTTSASYVGYGRVEANIFGTEPLRHTNATLPSSPPGRSESESVAEKSEMKENRVRGRSEKQRKKNVTFSSALYTTTCGLRVCGDTRWPVCVPPPSIVFVSRRWGRVCGESLAAPSTADRTQRGAWGDVKKFKKDHAESCIKKYCYYIVRFILGGRVPGSCYDESLSPSPFVGPRHR